MRKNRARVPLSLGYCSISCIVWGEDALSYYSVPTVVFSLSILVDDVEEAAKCLSDSGLARLGLSLQDKLNPRLDDDGHLPRFEGPLPSEPWPLKPASAASTFQSTPISKNCRGRRIQLHPASSWKFSLPSASTPPALVTEISPFPPLVPFVDSLIDGYLDLPHRQIRWQYSCPHQLPARVQR